MQNTPVHIVFDHQGSGKTTCARQLADDVNATHFSIDEWMGALFGPDLPKPISFSWVMQRVQRCEQQIWKVAVANCETRRHASA